MFLAAAHQGVMFGTLATWVRSVSILKKKISAVKTLFLSSKLVTVQFLCRYDPHGSYVSTSYYWMQPSMHKYVVRQGSDSHVCVPEAEGIHCLVWMHSHRAQCERSPAHIPPHNLLVNWVLRPPWAFTSGWQPAVPPRLTLLCCQHSVSLIHSSLCPYASSSLLSWCTHDRLASIKRCQTSSYLLITLHTGSVQPNCDSLYMLWDLWQRRKPVRLVYCFLKSKQR